MQHFLLIADYFIHLINYYPGLESSPRLGIHTNHCVAECGALLLFHRVKWCRSTLLVACGVCEEEDVGGAGDEHYCLVPFVK